MYEEEINQSQSLRVIKHAITISLLPRTRTMGLLCGGLEHEVHMVGIRIQCTVVVAGKGMEEPRVTLGEPLGTESGHTIGTRGTRERERDGGGSTLH